MASFCFNRNTSVYNFLSGISGTSIGTDIVLSRWYEMHSQKLSPEEIKKTDIYKKYLEEYKTDFDEQTAKSKAFESAVTETIVNDLKATELYKKLQDMYKDESMALGFLITELQPVLSDLGNMNVSTENPDEMNQWFDELSKEQLKTIESRHRQITEIKNGLDKRTPDLREDLIPNKDEDDFNGYKEDEEYGEMMLRAREFETMRKNGEITLQEINELEDVFVSAFRHTMNKIASGDIVAFPSYSTLMKYERIRERMDGNIDASLSLLVKNGISFNEILQAVVNSMKSDFNSMVLKMSGRKSIELDDIKKRLLSNLLLFDKYKTQFLLNAQPKLQSQLKLKVPVTFLATHKNTNDVEYNEQEEYDDEIDQMISDMEESENYGVNDKLADGDNTVVSRDNYSINILTIDLKRSLSRELTMKMSNFLDSTDPVNRYGGANYYDQNAIYRSIMKICYDCTNAGMMMDRIRSDEFTHPWKKSLLGLLESNTGLATKLFNAICTSFNKYLKIIIDESNDEVSAAESNMIKSYDALFDQLLSVATAQNPLLEKKSSDLEDKEKVVKNLSTVYIYKSYMDFLQSMFKTYRTPKDGADITNKFYYIQTSDKSQKRLMYNGKPASTYDISTLYSNTTIGDLIDKYGNANTALPVSNVKIGDLKKLTMEEFFDKILTELGMDQVSGTDKMAKHILYYAYTNKGTDNKTSTFYGDRIKFISDRLINALVSGGAHPELFNDNNQDALKYIVWLVNGSLVNNYDFSSLSDGKPYQTHTYCSHLMYELYKMRNMTADEIKARRQKIVGDVAMPVNEREFDVWEGEFFKESWYNSWEKDWLLYAEKHDQNKCSNGFFDLHTFQAFNDQSWADLDTNDYLMSQFYAFWFKYNEHNTRFYSLPQMEDKGTAYFISQRAYSAFRNQDGYSDISLAEASIFMKELSRIKRTYMKALQRRSNLNIDKKHDCKLAVYKDGTLSTNLDLDSRLNDASFQYLGSMNRLLMHINLSASEIDGLSTLDDNEKKLVKMMRKYIYDGDTYSRKDDVDDAYSNNEDIAKEAAVVLHNTTRDTFERDWDAALSANIWTYALIINEYYSYRGNTESLNYDHRIRQYVQTYLKAKENLRSGEIENKQMADAKDMIMHNPEIVESIKQLVFYQYYNQQHAVNEMLNMFSGDIAQFGGIDTATKRLSQFVSSGIIPDSTKQNTVKVMVLETEMKKNALPEITKEAIRTATINLHTAGRDFDSLPKEEQDRITLEAEKVVSDYDSFDATDGQSIMSIDFLEKYLESIGRLTDNDRTYLELVKRVYTCEDDELDWYLTKLNNFLRKNNVSEMNTLKTHTLSIQNIKVNGVRYNEKKNVQIKTAIMLPLDVNQFIHDGKRDKNNMFYKMQTAMLDNDLGFVSFDSATKVYIPESTAKIDWFTGDSETVRQRIKKELENSNCIVDVELSDNIMALETPSHFLDNKRQAGIQMVHLITQSINDNEKYTIKLGDGKTEEISGKDLYNKINSLWEDKYTIIYNEIIGKLKKIEGEEISAEQKQWEKNRYISELLLKELYAAENFSYQTWYSLQLDEKGNFMVPINTSSLMILVQKLVFNKIKKELVAAPTSGGYLVQTANIYNFHKGDEKYDDELGYELDEKGNIISLMVDMPLYNSKLIERYMDPVTREIDMESIRKHNPEALEMICYRIPTEGYCSMYKIKVRRFTDPKAGGNITLPPAITKISGSDFDIDKMFFFSPAIGKNYRPVPCGTESKEAIDNYLLEIYKSILSHPSTLAERMKSQGFEDIEELDALFKRIALYKNKENDISLEDVFNENFPIPYHADLRDFGNPVVQADFHVRNSVSKDSVGIFANPNTLHALLMHHNVKIYADDIETLKINGHDFVGKDGFVKFNAEFCVDQITKMGSQLRQPLGAAVDDAKNPKFASLNINTDTADLVTTFIMMGFTLKQAILLINQPVIKYLSWRYKMTRPLRPDFSKWLSEEENAYNWLEYEYEGINIQRNGKINFDMSERDLTLACCEDGTDEEAMQKQINQILPLVLKAAKVAHEFKLSTPRLKCDNSGKTDWTSIYEYVSYIVNRDIMKNKIENGESQFTKEMNDIFEGENQRMTTIENLTHNVAQTLLQSMGVKYTPDYLRKIAMQILNATGNDYISPYTIRELVSAISTYMYVNSNKSTGGVHPITDTKYYIGDNKSKDGTFAFDIVKAKAWFAKQGKYKNLFGPKGLVKTHLSRFKATKTTRGFSIVNTYLFNEDHSFRNTMSTEWEQMFYDDTIIDTLGIKVKDMANMILNYFILKNGFNVNNGSLMLVLPVLAINDPRVLSMNPSIVETYTDRLISDNDINGFIELFCRNNKELVATYGEYNKETDTRLTIMTPEQMHIPEGEETPMFIKWGFCFYKKMSDGKYMVLPWLGRDGICREYKKNLIQNPEETLIEGTNKLWKYEKKQPESKPEQEIIKSINLKNTLEKVNRLVNSKQQQASDITKIAEKTLGLNNVMATQLVNHIISGNISEALGGIKDNTSEKQRKLFQNYIDNIIEKTTNDCK